MHINNIKVATLEHQNGLESKPLNIYPIHIEYRSTVIDSKWVISLLSSLKVTLEVSVVLGIELYVFPSKTKTLILECGLLFNICIIRLDLQIED